MQSIERKAELCPDQGAAQDITTAVTANRGRLTRCDFSRAEIERALVQVLARMIDVDLRAEGVSYTTEFRVERTPKGLIVRQATVSLLQRLPMDGGIDG